MEFGIVSYGAIVILCYLLGLIIKNIDKIDDKWIPASVGCFGLVLGVVAYIINVPDFPAQNIFMAAAVGVISGFASTGINQLFKQLQKD